jgi:hypothetical protein
MVTLVYASVRHPGTRRAALSSWLGSRFWSFDELEEQTMKRARVLLAVIAAVVTATAGLPGTPALAANPTASYDVTVAGGSVIGSLTWLNRSVDLTGTVRDYNSSPGGYTQARFTFSLRNSTTTYSTTTRTASYDTARGYHFTQPGPVGGIWRVDVTLCTSAGACDLQGDILIRP